MLLDLAANLGFGLAGGYGSKPQVAQYKNVPTGPAGAVGANTQAFPAISNLGNLYQSYLQDQYGNAGVDITGLGRAGSNAAQSEYGLGTSLLQGDLPQSFWDQINREAAQQALGGGYAGSSMAGFGKANLTYDQLLKQILLGEQLVSGAGNAAQRAASLAQSTQYDPEKMFTNPDQLFREQYLNTMGRLGTQQSKYNVAAAPDPRMVGAGAAVGNTLGQLTSAGGILGSYGGGGASGGSQGGGIGGGGGGGGGILGLLMGLI